MVDSPKWTSWSSHGSGTKGVHVLILDSDDLVECVSIDVSKQKKKRTWTHHSKSTQRKEVNSWAHPVWTLVHKTVPQPAKWHERHTTPCAMEPVEQINTKSYIGSNGDRQWCHWVKKSSWWDKKHEWCSKSEKPANAIEFEGSWHLAWTLTLEWSKTSVNDLVHPGLICIW